MFKKFPLISRFILFIILPLTAITFGFVLYGKQSLKVGHGELYLNGVKGETELIYDERGVAFIKSDYDLDAFFTLGFSHAQNRLWQMEMDRRMASGRLSEILGNATVSSDRFMRTMGLKENAQSIYDNLHGRELDVINSYVKGVNQGISTLKKLPIEFTFFRYEPEPWTAVDSMLKLQLVTLQQSTNLSEELLNSLLLNSFDNTVLKDIFSTDLLAELSEGEGLDPNNVGKLFSELPEQFAYPRDYVGSNAWAIASRHSSSGKPLLANDPHLDNTIPSIFYLAHIQGKNLNVTGATFPGLPFVVAGRNEHMAWGITSMVADTQDVYIEQLNPFNSNEYKVDDNYFKMDSVREEIKIKADYLKASPKPYVFSVRRTHRGPIISDVVPNMHQTLSLRWTGDSEDGGTITSFLNMNYATNAADFIGGLNSYVAPVLNIVYADNSGNIGSIAPGKYPIRSRVQGLLPTPGWKSELDWKQWIPQTQWPQIQNPKSGIISSANNDVLTEDYPYYISDSWAPNFRVDRINELLLNSIKLTSGKVSLDNFAAVQQDIQHPMQALLVKMIDKVEKNVTLQDHSEAMEILTQWNGDMSSDSAAAALVSSWLAHLNSLIFEDEIKRSGLPEQAFYGLTRQLNYKILSEVLLGESPIVCAYNYLATNQDCDEVIILALKRAIREVNVRLGGEIKDWQWSELASTHYSHFPFSGSRFTSIGEQADNKVMASLYHRSLPGSSTGESVNAKGVSLGTKTRYYQMYGASYRQLIDLGNGSIGRFVLSTGQSGNIFSPHFDDMLTLFSTQHYHTFKEPQTASAIIIRPQGSK